MSGTYKDLSGQTFGYLTVLEDTGKRNKGGRVVWRCVCGNCGNIHEIITGNLKLSPTKACGCKQREFTSRLGKSNITHGDTANGKIIRLYTIWASMKGRCKYKKCNTYKYYGGRGIRICKEWDKSYMAFKKWAMKNGYSDDLTIDRINNNGNYEPKNCQWISLSDNLRKEKIYKNLEFIDTMKMLYSYRWFKFCDNG